MENSNWNKIQDYFEGNMSEEEMKIFDKNLKEDLALSNEVDTYKELVKGIENHGRKAFLEQIHQEEFGTANTAKKINKFPWFIGLLILLIGGYFISSYLGEGQKNKDEAQVEHIGQYATIMSALDGLPVTLSTDSEVLFSEAMIAYRMKDYSKSLMYLDKLSANGVNSDTVSIYRANVYIELGQNANALEVLNVLKKDVSSSYYQDAIWFEAKAYLNVGNKNRAKENLNFLINAGSKYSEMALKVLQNIE